MITIFPMPSTTNVNVVFLESEIMNCAHFDLIAGILDDAETLLGQVLNPICQGENVVQMRHLSLEHHADYISRNMLRCESFGTVLDEMTMGNRIASQAIKILLAKALETGNIAVVTQIF